LRHADRVVTHVVATDVAAQPREGETADDGLVRLASAVSPLVIVVEATDMVSYEAKGSEASDGTYPAVNISMR
jgi:hypothetical protein